MRKTYLWLEYCHTNENLDAIVKGLNPTKDDIVLAVGGSGDQAFALLENAKAVTAIDPNPKQIDYIEERAKHLLAGDYEAFLHVSYSRAARAKESRDEYFRKPGRLDAIRSNVRNLTATNENIFEPMPGHQTKIYLSNAIGYEHYKSITKNQFHDTLKALAETIPEGGLIYLANHEDLMHQAIMNKRYRPRMDPDETQKITLPGELLPKELKLDLEQTQIAREHTNLCWEPAVYRRVR